MLLSLYSSSRHAVWQRDVAGSFRGAECACPRSVSGTSSILAHWLLSYRCKASGLRCTVFWFMLEQPAVAVQEVDNEAFAEEVAKLRRQRDSYWQLSATLQNCQEGDMQSSDAKVRSLAQSPCSSS